MILGGVTLIAVSCWLVAAVKLRAARRRRDPAQRSLGLSLACIGAGVALFEPVLYRGVDRLAGMANLAALLGQVMVLIAALHARVFLLRLTGTPSRSWRRWCALVLTAAVMTASFAAAPVAEYAPVVFSPAYARSAGVVPYWAAFLAYLVFTLSAVARLSLRYAAMSTQPLMRRGLVLVAVGTSLGIAYFAYWGVRLLVLRAGHVIPDGVDLALRQLLVASNGLILLGIALPAGGQQLATRRAYWQLYPLWRDITRAVPGVVLEQPATALTARLAVRGATLRLYRRVIEIQDGRLVLRDRLDGAAGRRAGEHAAAAGLQARDVAAAAEAAMLSTALHGTAGRAGNRPSRGGTAVSGGTDSDEVQWLLRLTRAYRHSPDGRVADQPDSDHAAAA